MYIYSGELEEESLTAKRELILLLLVLFSIPIALFQKFSSFLELNDTHWLFVWGVYSEQGSIPTKLLPFINMGSYRFAALTSWFLVGLWTLATVISYLTPQRGDEKTLWRDMGVLGTLMVIQVASPLILFPLAVQGTPYYMDWILPVPGPTVCAMILRMINGKGSLRLSGV